MWGKNKIGHSNSKRLSRGITFPETDLVVFFVVVVVFCFCFAVVVLFFTLLKNLFRLVMHDSRMHFDTSYINGV